MSPETLMRVYKRCNRLLNDFERFSDHNQILKWKRLSEKIEARILKYASASYQLRLSLSRLARKEKLGGFYEGTEDFVYEPTAATLKFKSAIVYETQLQHRTECFPVFDATKHVGPVEDPTIDVQQLFIDRIETAGNEYRAKLSEFYKKKELDAAMVNASDEIADTIMRTNPLFTIKKD